MKVKKHKEEKNMKYFVAKKKIKSGDILAWCGKGFFSHTVKLLTKSQYSHIGFAWKIGNRLMVVEALEGKGVRIFPTYRTTPFYWLPLKKGVFTKYKETKMLSHIGDSYSWFGCVRGWLGLKTREDRRFQCAEFVNYIMEFGRNYDTPIKIVTHLLQKGTRLIFVKKLNREDYNKEQTAVTD